jgi:hypothetical protein
MRQRAARRTPIPHTTSPYHLPPRGQHIASKAHRTSVAARCTAPAVQQSSAVALTLIDHDDRLRNDCERYSVPLATHHNAHGFSRRRSLPGVGTLLALGLLDELHALQRCPRGQACVSDGHLVKGATESAGTR